MPEHWEAKELGPDSWRVVNGDRSWTLHQLPDGSWNITEYRGQPVKQDGLLGETLLDVIRIARGEQTGERP